MPSVCPKMPPQVSCVAGTDDESEDGETETEPGRPYRSGSGSWHRQLSPCSVLSAASSGRLYAEPAQTLIFLDWDDTIFPFSEAPLQPKDPGVDAVPCLSFSCLSLSCLGRG